jgi:hypothetical protein
LRSCSSRCTFFCWLPCCCWSYWCFWQPYYPTIAGVPADSPGIPPLAGVLTFCNMKHIVLDCIRLVIFSVIGLSEYLLSEWRQSETIGSQPIGLLNIGPFL